MKSKSNTKAKPTAKAKSNTRAKAKPQAKTKVPAKTKPAVTAAPPPATRGSIGQQTFEQVTKLVANEKISLAQAFKRVAESTGRSADTIENTYYRIARKHRARSRAKMGGKRRGRPSVTTATPTPAPHGSIGQQTFDRVQELVAKEQISRDAAFTKVAAATGRSAGTISNTYYRVARAQGGAVLAKKGAVVQGRRGRPPVSSSGAASGLLTQLAEMIRRQEQELDKLRKENARLQEIRKLLGS